MQMDNGNDASLKIPMSLVLQCLKNHEVFRNVINLPEFRRWMLDQVNLLSEMMRDKQISSYIHSCEQGEDEDLWNICWDAVFKAPLEPAVAPTTSTTSRNPTFGASEETCYLGAGGVTVHASSVKGTATCKVSETEMDSKSRVKVASESTYGDTLTSVGSLRISDTPRKQGGAVLNSESKSGNASTNVDTIVLGGTYNKTHGGTSKVRSGIAFSGQSSVAKGVFYSERCQQNPPDSATGISCEFDGVKDKLKNGTTVYTRSGDLPTRESVSQAQLKDPNRNREGTKVGIAMFKSKKLDIELQDSGQQVTAFAESTSSDSVFNVDEIVIKATKPQPVQKTYNIDKVVGSLYVESTITSNFQDCTGDLSSAETTVGSEPKVKNKTSSSSASKKKDHKDLPKRSSTNNKAEPKETVPS